MLTIFKTNSDIIRMDKKNDILKISASEAKMNIIRELSKGQRTPSDLSKILKKSKSTVVEHLDSLVSLGLVNKIEQKGKKWVFYSLTKDGYDIIQVKPKASPFILASSLLSIILGFAFLIFNKTLVSTRTFDEKISSSVTTEMIQQSTFVSQIYFYISIFFFALGVFCFIFYLHKKRMVKE